MTFAESPSLSNTPKMISNYLLQDCEESEVKSSFFWLTDWLTRTPIELSGTARKKPWSIDHACHDCHHRVHHCSWLNHLRIFQSVPLPDMSPRGDSIPVMLLSKLQQLYNHHHLHYHQHHHFSHRSHSLHHPQHGGGKPGAVLVSKLGGFVTPSPHHHFSWPSSSSRIRHRLWTEDVMSWEYMTWN